MRGDRLGVPWSSGDEPDGRGRSAADALGVRPGPCLDALQPGKERPHLLVAADTERIGSLTSWFTGVCAANGINIRHLRTGRPKPALLLLHGLTASGACWSPLARALEDEYDSVMPDARGHGHSSAPLTGYRYEHHADDVIGLTQALGLTTPVLLGHSMGGMTAAVVASRVGRAIRGVVLAEPTFLSLQRQREVHQSDVVERHRRLLSLDKDDVLAQARVRYAHRSPELVELIAAACWLSPLGERH